MGGGGINPIFPTLLRPSPLSSSVDNSKFDPKWGADRPPRQDRKKSGGKEAEETETGNERSRGRSSFKAFGSWGRSFRRLQSCSLSVDSMTRRRSPWDGEEMPESDDILQECIWIPAWICREGKISASIPKQYSAHSTVYCTVCASRGRFARHPNGNFPWEGEGDFAAFCASCRNHMPPSQSRGRPTFTKKSDYPDPPSLILFTRHRICVRYRQHMKALGGSRT